LAPHYCEHEENWPGGFFRDEAVDKHALEPAHRPAMRSTCTIFHIAGQTVSYQAAMQWFGAVIKMVTWQPLWY